MIETLRLNADDSMKDHPITIVCGADDKFAMPLTVTLFSAVINLNKNSAAHIYILDGGIQEKNKLKIANCLNKTGKITNLVWLTCDMEKLDDMHETEVISKAAYLRVLIPELLPQTCKKAIYLDCDMIVEVDLMKLWEHEFNDESAMGVQDYWSPYISTVPVIDDYEQLGLYAGTPYCNSGLLVMNLPYWREHDLKTRVFDYLKKNKLALDQDAINVAVGGNWKLLDPHWNVTISSLSLFGKKLLMSDLEQSERQQELRNSPFIIHFTSRFKPWHSGRGNKEALTCFYYDQSFISRFFYYLKASGWYSLPQFWYRNAYRKSVLFFEFKLPRRWSFFRRRKRILCLPA